MDLSDCIEIYREKSEDPDEAIDDVVKAIIKQANKEKIEGSTARTIKRVYWKAQHLFESFANRMIGMGIYIPRETLVAYIRANNRGFYEVLLASRFQPALDYEAQMS